jgi:hypothetical protein
MLFKRTRPQLAVQFLDLNTHPWLPSFDMDNPETLRPVSRPPSTVIAMSMFWCLGGCLEFMVWLIERETFYLMFVFVAAIFTVLILKGFRWIFWINLGILALSLGVALLQLQIPSWAPGTPTMMLWIRAFIAVVLIILHQFPSLRHWFGIRGRGKRWQILFWLLVAGLTALGQYILPTIKALRG